HRVDLALLERERALVVDDPGVHQPGVAQLEHVRGERQPQRAARLGEERADRWAFVGASRRPMREPILGQHDEARSALRRGREEVARPREVLLERVAVAHLRERDPERVERHARTLRVKDSYHWGDSTSNRRWPPRGATSTWR